MKATIPKIKTGKYASGNPFWRVTYSLGGKQVNKKFPSEREANEHKQDVIRKFHGGVSLKDQDAARLAFEKFRAYQSKDADLAKLDFSDLVDWACQNFQPAIGEDLEMLIDEFLTIKRKQGLREQTITELENYLYAFRDDFKGRTVETFTRRELEEYINVTKKPFNKNRFGTLKHFFAWLSGTSQATPIDNPILRDTPFRGWIKGRKDDEQIENIVIYTAEECRKILEVAAKHNAQAMFAFLLFTGCRPFEAVRIWDDHLKYGWNQVNWEKGIFHIPAAVSKTRKPRQVPLNGTLRAWLEHYKDCETLIPPNWRYKYTDVRKEALEGAKMVTDVPRHTFISQMLEKGESFAKIALICGNSKEMILDHYASLSNEAECDAFFDLTPDKFENHDVPMEEYKLRAKRSQGKGLRKQHEKNRENWSNKRQPSQ